MVYRLVFLLFLGILVVGHTLDKSRWGDLPRGWAQQYAKPQSLSNEENEYVNAQLKRIPVQPPKDLNLHLNLQKKLQQISTQNENIVVAPDSGRRLKARRTRNKIRTRQVTGTCSYANLTVCDDPHVRDGYAAAATRWTPDVQTYSMEYDIVVFAEDDGSNPTATTQQIIQQNDILNSVFYNFTTLSTARLRFNFTILSIHRSLLRYRYVIPGQCNNKEILNNRVDDACMTEATGFDGGQLMCPVNSTCNPVCRNYADVLRRIDCPCICREELKRCKPEMVANRYCNEECNWPQFNYDGGDCCPPPNAFNQSGAILSQLIGKNFTCRDPNNPFVSYMGTDDFFFLLNPPTRTNKTVVYVVAVPPDMDVRGGYATQWKSPTSKTNEAGIFIDSLGNHFGAFPSKGMEGETLVRLMGEVLGLLPVDQGVTGIANTTTLKTQVCADPCYEAQARDAKADITGDLISDTLPTPINFNASCKADLGSCDAPIGADAFCRDCIGNNYVGTPVKNFMSYTGDVCKDHFTPQQVGRLYCYIDVVLRNWMREGNTVPGPIIEVPLARAVNASGTILVTWVPPYINGTLPGEILNYLLEREPAFETKMTQVNGVAQFVDKSVDPEKYYRYRVRALAGVGAGVWSPWSNYAGGLKRTCRCADFNLELTADADWHRVNGCSGKKTK